MTKTINEKISKLAQKCDLLPNILRIIADSFCYIMHHNKEYCAIRFNGTKLRLFCKKLIVLSVENSQIWITTNDDNSYSKLEHLVSWKWDVDEYGTYRKPKSRNGFYNPIGDHSNEWQVIQKTHFDYLDQVFLHANPMDIRTASKCDQEAMKFFENYLNGDSKLLTSSNNQFLEDYNTATLQTLDAPSYLENSQKQIAHLVRERNHAVVRAKHKQVLIENGYLFCEACNFVTNSIYQDFSSEICEVHHLNPLSLSQDLISTRLEDLAILCPNCHRAIHKSKKTLSIQEFKSQYLTKKAK